MSLDPDLKELLAQLLTAQAKTEAQLTATEKQLSATNTEFTTQLAARNAEMKETAAQHKADYAVERARSEALDKKLDKIGRMVGNISNNQGDIAEEFFANTIGHTQCVGGIQYDMIYSNLAKRYKGVQDEYDIVLVNGKHIAIIETKYKAHENDLEKLVTKKYDNFKKLYPEYANYEHHLGLASFYINDSLKAKALAQGVMVLQRKGDLIESTCP